jgi:transglutaminase-like putative cysteine protease
MRYDLGRTDADTTGEAALSAGHGVCQDHAHAFIACARLLGFPARYVSGYLKMTDSSDQDAGHAWAEAHVDGLGWVGFDISNGISPDERYVRLATGLDYAEAAPTHGLAHGNAASGLSVAVQVQQQ